MNRQVNRRDAKLPKRAGLIESVKCLTGGDGRAVVRVEFDDGSQLVGYLADLILIAEKNKTVETVLRELKLI